ncbi:endoplasmic reticulum-Golgi intermediate compartment protein 2-like [Artemia franciscana]|uniref:endoplasmic reticulum-Golgi intermediate compartment protein 2-like n=1 Tax=Artemia franciscana TaxID=6661 RepID=UPI0032DA053D
MNSEYELQLKLQDTFAFYMDPELLASNGEVEDMDISRLTYILPQTHDMSFAPLLDHGLRDYLDCFSLAVSAALPSDIQEDQTLSMNATFTFSSIQVVSADVAEDILPLALNLAVSALSRCPALAQGLLDTEAGQCRSRISENELSPSTHSTSLRIQLAAEPVIEIDNEVFLIKGRPILSWCDLEMYSRLSVLGADVVDTTDQSAILFGRLHEEETWFDLDYRQRMHFDTLRRTNRYLSDEYHTLKHQIWKSDYAYFFSGMPARVDIPNKPKDACRYHGTLTLNKVAGNFHITQGKVLPIPGVHIHVGHIMQDFRGNFSHRVEKFSFGPGAKGIVQPLEGEEQIDEMPLKYQYWLQVVPTDIQTSYSRRKTQQYSVRDYARPVKKGEMQGIYFKYDFSAMRVRIEDDGEYFAMFLVRLSSIIGGIYITVGIFNGAINFLWELILCRSLSKLPK